MSRSFSIGVIKPGANDQHLREIAFRMASAARPREKVDPTSIGSHEGIAYFGSAFREGNLLLIVGGEIHVAGKRGPEFWRKLDSEARKCSYLLDGYRNDGTQFLETLYGDFSLVIYNFDSKEIALVRDMLGVMPLFHSCSQGYRVFGPSMPAILASGVVRRNNCARKIFSFLQGSELPGNLSCVEGVYRVPSSHVATLDPSGKARLLRYCKLGEGVQPSKGSFEDNATALRTLFLDSVARRLPATGLVGAEVSGGLDSSSVFSAARSLAGERILPMSGVFPLFPSCDESPFIDAVCERWGTKSNKVDVDAQSLVAFAKRGLTNFQGLHNAANIHITSAISDFGRDMGCVAVLNGVDGDNVVSHGRNHLYELGIAGEWQEFVRLALLTAPSYARYSNAPAAGFCYTYGVPALCHLLLRGRSVAFVKGWRSLSSVPGVSRRYMLESLRTRILRKAQGLKAFGRAPRAKRIWKGRFPRVALKNSFLEELDVGGCFAEMFPETENECLMERDAHVLSFENGVNQHYFEYTWANSAAEGIPTVSPFMDRSLLEFCVSIPPEQKLRSGFSRAILREAMKGLLPDCLLSRQWKTDLSPSSIHKVKSEVLPVFRAKLNERPDLLGAYIEPEYLSRELASLRDPVADRSANIRVWVLFCLSEWLGQCGAR